MRLKNIKTYIAILLTEKSKNREENKKRLMLKRSKESVSEREKRIMQMIRLRNRKKIKNQALKMIKQMIRMTKIKV